jgi:hypothetical protein
MNKPENHGTIDNIAGSYLDLLLFNFCCKEGTSGGDFAWTYFNYRVGHVETTEEHNRLKEKETDVRRKMSECVYLPNGENHR